MDKIGIKIVLLGNSIHPLSIDKIIKWKSEVFALKNMGTIALPDYATGEDWGYSDGQIAKALSGINDTNIVFAISSVPLDDNYYMRRLPGNKVVISLFQVGEILNEKSIPIENFVLKSIYETCVLYSLYRDREIPMTEIASVAHDETRGCLFDMTGIKQEISVSSKAPILCDICYGKYLQKHVPKELLDKIREELKKIRLPRYDRIVVTVKKRPVVWLVVTAAISIALSVLGNYISHLFGM